eukprot:4378648-Pleurochrysis_carterae.AAC.3
MTSVRINRRTRIVPSALGFVATACSPASPAARAARRWCSLLRARQTPTDDRRNLESVGGSVRFAEAARSDAVMQRKHRASSRRSQGLEQLRGVLHEEGKKNVERGCCMRFRSGRVCLQPVGRLVPKQHGERLQILCGVSRSKGAREPIEMRACDEHWALQAPLRNR